MPDAMPVSRPEDAPMVATKGALLAQDTPGVGSVTTLLEPMQRLVLPTIAAGSAFTVMLALRMQPAEDV